MTDYTFDGDYVPLAYDTDPKYFDLSIPADFIPNAEDMMNWLDWQQSMVPKMYRDNPDVWQIYDLEAYQAFISDYISVKAAKDHYGKSIHTQDRSPFS